MFFRFVETSYSKFNQSAKLYLSTYPDFNRPPQGQSSEKSSQQSSSYLKNPSLATDASQSSLPMVTTGSSAPPDGKELTRSRSLSIDMLNQPTSILQIRHDKTTVRAEWRYER